MPERVQVRAFPPRLRAAPGPGLPRGIWFALLAGALVLVVAIGLVVRMARQKRRPAPPAARSTAPQTLFGRYQPVPL